MNPWPSLGSRMMGIKCSKMASVETAELAPTMASREAPPSRPVPKDSPYLWQRAVFS